MVLENKLYVPTLAVRPSEMTGLEFLPGATKDRMTPCFLLAPWANSNSIERTITRIERAFPNRPYFLDIDPDYEPTNLDSRSQQELLLLKEPANCYGNWVAFIREHNWVWPCVQTRRQSKAEIETQIKKFQAQGRPCCMRLLINPPPSNLEEIVNAFAAAGTADYAIILEGGWTNDPLSLSGLFNGVITEGLKTIDASVPIVLSFTSMPKMFDKCSASTPTAVPFINRRLVEQAARNSNRARIIYGDWGSTRPREIGGFANRPLDRIDYPTENDWRIARNKEDEWDFRDAALAILKNSSWDGNLGIWGEEMIRNTAINMELGIDTAPKNVASRVNIHLHRQAFSGAPLPSPVTLDEDWED